MTQVVLDLPSESLMAFQGSQERTGTELRMAAAAKLYELGRLSSGAAAALAGVPRAVFLTRLADYGVATFGFDANEFEREARLA